MKNYLSAIIFGIAIIIAAFLLGRSYMNRNNTEGTISVTGLGKADFTSDLIVWEGNFRTQEFSLQKAYSSLREHQELISLYLVSKGVPQTAIVFSAVNTNKRNKNIYSSSGKFIGEEFLGYDLSQDVQIESTEVAKIEKISREITELLNQGVQLYSQPPRYYYTKLSDLKVEMISKATEDARIRAEKISEFSGGNLGKLISAKMGVFQITGQNSGEQYSWAGTFNTASKEKTASITMKLLYKVD